MDKAQYVRTRHLDAVPRDQLAPDNQALARVLADWWRDLPPGSHGVGLFLERLAKAGYRVVKRP